MPLQEKDGCCTEKGEGRVFECLWDKQDNNITELSCDNDGLSNGLVSIVFLSI